MRELTTAERQCSGLRSLQLLKEYCDEHHLRYYLAFGTLLGAVRHRGFIPWDDDIDVFLPRSDYNELMAHFNDWSKAKAEKREAICRERNPEWYLYFGKVIDRHTALVEFGKKLEIGVGIDLYPMDAAPKTIWMMLRLNFYIKLLHYLWVDERPGRKAYRNLIVRIFQRLTPSIEWTEQRKDRLVRKVEQNAWEGHYAFLYRNFFKSYIPMFRKSDFDPSVELEFEGDRYLAPKEYEKLLRLFYGNYQALPPAEKRVTTHLNTCVWKETPVDPILR